jgi:hypothetical protein
MAAWVRWVKSCVRILLLPSLHVGPATPTRAGRRLSSAATILHPRQFQRQYLILVRSLLWMLLVIIIIISIISNNNKKNASTTVIVVMIFTVTVTISFYDTPLLVVQNFSGSNHTPVHHWQLLSPSPSLHYTFFASLFIRLQVLDSLNLCSFLRPSLRVSLPVVTTCPALQPSLSIPSPFTRPDIYVTPKFAAF